MKNSLFDYHINDSRNVKEIIRDKLVDVIITSPPYWNLKDYGVNNQIGFGQSYEKYLDELTSILNNCKDILKDRGSMWIVVDSFKKGGNIRMLPFEVAQRLQNKGWHLQDIIIWQKDKTLPWSSKGKLRNIFEYVLFFTKSNKFNFYVDELREINLKKWWPKYPERYNPKGKVPSRVWEISIPVQGWGKSLVKHFCPFPPKLVENILFLTTKKNYVVLDPFAGSGSVLAQATVMDRKAIGFDLNSDYKEMYNRMVLPYFKELWLQREKEIKNISQKRKYLEKTIPKLRKIKYPIQFYKELNKIEPEIAKQVVGIVLYLNKKLKYYLIIDNVINISPELISKIMNQKVMKKFSLNPTIRFVQLKEASNLGLNNSYYIYNNGVNNYYTNKNTFRDWIENTDNKGKTKVPPILANLKVSQKNHQIIDG